MTEIKAVFFDFYGTLYVLRDPIAELDEWITALHAHICNHGATATRNDVWEYYQHRLWKGDIPKPDGSMTIFERRIQSICSDFGGSMTHPQVSATAEALLEVWDKYAYLDPDCMVVLDALKSRGRVLALISNYDHPRHVHRIVQSTGMVSRFSTVVVSGDHGVKKPDPAIFSIALERTGMRPGDTLYVGDSVEDMAGARSAGMVPVLVDRAGKGADYGQVWTITALPQVLRLGGIL